MAKSGDSEGDGYEVSTVDTKSELCGQNSDNSTYVISKPVKVTTPISILIESLVKNLCNVYEHEDEKSIKLYHLICDKLYDMKLIDESYNMIEFEGMRNQYQRALFHLFTTARGGEKPVPLQPFWSDNDVNNDWSHYYREFDEEDYIAGGGFGQVFRVKHKLDGTEYAVKKIYIRSDGIKSVTNYLSEVKTFASLNHPNIVQYKNAWLELGTPTNKNALMDQVLESDCTVTSEATQYYQKLSEAKEHIKEYVYPQVSTMLPSTRNAQKSSNFEVSFENSSCKKSRHYSSSNNLCSVSNTSKCLRSREKRNSISEGGNVICRVDFQNFHQIEARPRPKWATLYIQMALCQSTLKQWLEQRNKTEIPDDGRESALVSVNRQVRTDEIMEILNQLLRGLEYIHSKGIVHHDIKPSNIFMQLENNSLVVQLGDFGLACPLQSAKHSLAFGTKLYAAPEQLAGKCDPKSDMYSLGIVLLELVETFRTDMERVHTITELRKGHLSQHILSQHPQLTLIIKQLVSRYPCDRPDASSLLKHISSDNNESEVIRELKSKLAEKDEEISRLKELLKMAKVARE